jgi:hypothetical protein
MIAWGWGYIEAPPSRQELELNPKHPDDVLNDTSALWQAESLLREGVIGYQNDDLIFNCQHGAEVRLHCA